MWPAALSALERPPIDALPMTTEITLKSLDDILATSAAIEEFKQAVRDLESGKSQDLIRANSNSPPVKVLRTVMKMLEAYGEVPFESVEITAESSCSAYTGSAVAEPGGVRFDFDWDCEWRALQEGWRDAFGDPDQIRAAQTLGYQCFRKFEKS